MLLAVKDLRVPCVNDRASERTQFVVRPPDRRSQGRMGRARWTRGCRRRGFRGGPPGSPGQAVVGPAGIGPGQIRASPRANEANGISLFKALWLKH